MRCESQFRAACARTSRASGNSSGPRTGTRLATDGEPGAVTLTARPLPRLQARARGIRRVGPFGGPLQGEREVLFIVSAPDEDTIRQRAADDPWTRNGMLTLTTVER